MRYNHPNNILRRAMLEIAPRVEELSGLKAPRRHGHPVHPTIKWILDPWHAKYYAFYRPSKRTIFINTHWVNRFIESRQMTLAVIAHEYTHYLQHIRWSLTDWNDVKKLERHAFEVENHFVPDGYQIDIDLELTCYDDKGNIIELGYKNWTSEDSSELNKPI